MTKKELDNLKERADLNNVQERSGVTIGKMQGAKMNKYRLQKENNHLRITEDSRIFIEAENIDEVKKYLKDNKMEFIRYSILSDTIYYKAI